MHFFSVVRSTSYFLHSQTGGWVRLHFYGENLVKRRGTGVTSNHSKRVVHTTHSYILGQSYPPNTHHTLTSLVNPPPPHAYILGQSFPPSLERESPFFTRKVKTTVGSLNAKRRKAVYIRCLQRRARTTVTKISRVVSAHPRLQSWSIKSCCTTSTVSQKCNRRTGLKDT